MRFKPSFSIWPQVACTLSSAAVRARDTRPLALPLTVPACPHFLPPCPRPQQPLLHGSSHRVTSIAGLGAMNGWGVSLFSNHEPPAWSSHRRLNWSRKRFTSGRVTH